jgi:hypothetical protein
MELMLQFRVIKTTARKYPDWRNDDTGLDQGFSRRIVQHNNRLVG